MYFATAKIKATNTLVFKICSQGPRSAPRSLNVKSCWFFETGSLYIALAVLGHTMYTSLSLNSQRPICFGLLSTKIKSGSQYTYHELLSFLEYCSQNYYTLLNDNVFSKLPSPTDTTRPLRKGDLLTHA